MGRHVLWHLTGKGGSYCYSGDAGKFDLVHVEVNKMVTKIKKRHPNPESLDQCVARHSFELTEKFNIFLCLRCNGNRPNKNSD